MGQIDAFRLEGLEIKFCSNDHPPVHLHVVRRGQWAIRVFVNETTTRRLVYEHLPYSRGRDPKAGDQKRLRTLVVQHRQQLEQEWQEKVQGAGEDE